MSKILAMFKSRTDVARFCVEAFLVLVLAYMCSQTFWKFMAPSGISLQAPSVSALSAPVYAEAKAAGHADGFVILTTTNPFSPRERSDLSVSAAALDAPETSLNLILRGVRANGNGAGVAFISLPDNRQVRASVGVEILDDVKVKYVFEDRVTLLTRGELETLYLRDPDSTQRGLEVSTRQDARTASTGVLQVSASSFLRNVSFVLVREGGTRAGYRLMPKSDGAALTSAGFEPEDIIRRVNASPVSEIDSEDFQELLLRSGVVDFDVERAGEPVRLSVRFLEGDRR